jgi:TRAP-type C4-dicarboxylate transport system permease small subunit
VISLKKIVKTLDRILDTICVLSLVSLAFIVSFQVAMRYIFSKPLSWTEELARFLLIWLIYIGCIAAMRDRKHITIDIIRNVVSKSTSRKVYIIQKIVSLIFLIMLFVYGIKMVLLNIGYTSTVNEIRLDLLYLCIPISAFGMLLYLVTLKNE